MVCDHNYNPVSRADHVWFELLVQKYLSTSGLCLPGQRLFGLTPMTTRCRTSECLHVANTRKKYKKAIHVITHVMKLSFYQDVKNQKLLFKIWFPIWDLCQVSNRELPNKTVPWSLGASSQLTLHRYHLFPFLKQGGGYSLMFFTFTFGTFWTDISQRDMRPDTVPTSTSVFSLTWTLKMFSPGSRLDHTSITSYLSCCLH